MRSLLSCALILTFSASAFAATAGHGAGHEVAPLAEYLKSLVPIWVNFIAYVAVLFFLLRKPFLGAWQSRRTSIGDRIKLASEKLEFAKSALIGAEKRMTSVEEDARTLRAEIELEAEIEAQRIVNDAQLRADAIQRQAKDAVQAERASSLLKLREELVDQAIRIARERLLREIDGNRDRAIRDSGIRRVSRLTQQGGVGN